MNRGIQTARKRVTNEIRIFKVHENYFTSKDYIAHIDWQFCVITKPPMTVKYSDSDLQYIITDKTILDLKKILCHTQSVERCVKIVT